MTDDAPQRVGGSHRAPPRRRGRGSAIAALVVVIAIAVVVVLLVRHHDGSSGQAGAPHTRTPSPAPAQSASSEAASTAASSASVAVSPPPASSGAGTAPAVGPASAIPVSSLPPVSSPPLSPPPPPPASKVPIVVINGTRITGLAARTASSMRSAGWSVTSTGTSYTAVPATSTAYYPPGGQGAAQELAAAFPALTRVLPAPSGDSQTEITVLLGANWPH